MDRIVEIIDGVWIDLEKVEFIESLTTGDYIFVHFSANDYVKINRENLNIVVSIWKDYHQNKFIHSRNFENVD